MRGDALEAAKLSVTHVVTLERGQTKHRVYAAIGWYGVLGEGVSLDDARRAVFALTEQIGTVRDSTPKMSDYRGIADRKAAPELIQRVLDQAEACLRAFMSAESGEWAGTECAEAECGLYPPIRCQCGGCEGVLFLAADLGGSRRAECPTCGCGFLMQERA